MAIDVISALKEAVPNQKYYLSYGSLLSATRERKPSMCNDDFDINLFDMKADTFTLWQDWQFRRALQKRGLYTWNRFYIYHVCRLDYEGEERENRQTCVVDLFPDQGSWTRIDNTSWIWPETYDVEYLEYENTKFPIPKNRKEILVNLYGNGYMTPLHPNRNEGCDKTLEQSEFARK